MKFKLAILTCSRYHFKTIVPLFRKSSPSEYNNINVTFMRAIKIIPDHIFPAQIANGNTLSIHGK